MYDLASELIKIVWHVVTETDFDSAVYPSTLTAAGIMDLDMDL